jgi:hypothetical protein
MKSFKISDMRRSDVRTNLKPENESSLERFGIISMKPDRNCGVKLRNKCGA